MGIFTGLVNMVTGGLVKDVGEAIDRNVTSDEERMKLSNELAEIMDKQKGRMHEAFVLVQEQITARHAADMKSDSWLAKNIRPIVLAILTVTTIFYTFTGLLMEFAENSYKATVFNAGLQALIALDMVVYGFYFGSRGVEKVATRVAEVFAKAKTQVKVQDRSVEPWDN